jgi:hypothetical protein
MKHIRKFNEANIERETLEDASWKYNPLKKLDGEFLRHAFKEGAKWQQERSYSEEEVVSILYSFHKEENSRVVFSLSGITKWFEQFKK